MPGTMQARSVDVAAARTELRAHAELLEASLLIHRDISRRANRNRHSKRLLQERREFGRLTYRLANAYIAALERYMAVIVKTAVPARRRLKSILSVTIHQ